MWRVRTCSDRAVRGGHHPGAALVISREPLNMVASCSTGLYSHLSEITQSDREELREERSSLAIEAVSLYSKTVSFGFSGLVPGKMATEGEPAALVKVLHLMILSSSWGMQLWMTFIAGFVLIRGVSRHTFGLVQSKLFPFYFYSVLGCAFLNLSIYATYHPRELLSPSESLQIVLFFLCLVLAAVNAQWLSQSTNKAMLKMQEIEREHGLGDEVGRKDKRDAYKTLQEKDPKYKALRHKFFRYHGLSSLCNLICMVCNGVNLAYAGLQLSEL